MKSAFENVTIHPSAIIEEDVRIGAHSTVWDYVHIRKGAEIGGHTTIGEKSYIAYGVTIGQFVKINAMVYIPYAVTIEDQCMISAGVVFTNDLYPRSMNKDLTDLETSQPTNETLATRVCKGVTIGANATIGPGVSIAPYAMVGMGAVVTKDVPQQGLVIGNPARLVGYVCVCGPKIVDFNEPPEEAIQCLRCGRQYTWNEDQLMGIS